MDVCRFLATALLALAAAVSAAPPGASLAEENDWLIVPGKRVGPLTPSTTRADLPSLFGSKNVVDAEIVTSDGGRQTGTRIFPDQPAAMLSIFWKDEGSNPHIRSIVFCQAAEPPATCQWHTAEDITFGTPLKMLEKSNQVKFRLNGFDWGYGGLVTSWNRGRLERMAASCGRLTVRLDPPPAPASDERASLISQVEGDDEFWSSEPAMQSLNPVIDWMSMSFANCSK